MNWKQPFKPQMLERSMAYYHSGHVGALEEDGQITAVVQGSEAYDVTIVCLDVRIQTRLTPAHIPPVKCRPAACIINTAPL